MESPPMVFPVRYEAGEAGRQSTSYALSANGVSIRSRKPPGYGAAVHLLLYLPDEAAPVQAEAVAREDRPGLFLAEFRNLGALARRRIENVTQARLEQMKARPRPELRGFPRFPARFRVVIAARGALLSEPVHDVSRSGLFVETHLEVETEEVVELDLHLPHTQGAHTAGLVTRRVSEGAMPGIGLVFLDGDDAFRESIDVYLGGVFEPLPHAFGE
jgi:hypothetical protein